jgi:Zn-dependent peptidase ImmA (M78 family)
MSGNFEDYIVKRRSREEIEAVAEALTRRHGILGPPVRIVEVLRVEMRSETSLLGGWRLVELSLSEMPHDEGRADFAQKRLEFRQGTLGNAERGSHRDKMTVAHEMGHVLLDHKDGGILHRVQQGNKKLGFGRQEESAEWQAQYFASAFLMPRDVVKRCSNATEVSLQCRVSLQAAQIRFDEINVRGAAKASPPEVAAFLAANMVRAANTGGTSKERAEAIVQRLWEKAAHAPGYDPNCYRLCSKGFRIDRAQHLNHRLPEGWCERDGLIKSYRDINRLGIGETGFHEFADAPCPHCGDFTLSRDGGVTSCSNCRREV